jgi:hypothetical protein
MAADLPASLQSIGFAGQLCLVDANSPKLLPIDDLPLSNCLMSV